jgi:hypothetical protein
MTQITPKELASVVCPRAQPGATMADAIAGIEGLVFGAVFLAGVVLGRARRSLG